MPPARAETTSQFPPTTPSRRRARGPRLLAAAALVVLAALVLTVRSGAEGRSKSANPQRSAPPVTTTLPARDAATLVTSVPPASTAKTQPAPTVTTTPARQERLSAESRLSLDGIGPVDIGMTLEEASTAAGTPIKTRPTDPYGPECQYAYAAAVPEVSFMVIKGRIARVDVGSPRGGRVSTVSGIRLGSTEEEVKRTYPGRIRVTGHPYVLDGHYLVYVPAEPALGHLGMIFETDGHAVTTFRSGLTGAVAQIEGCS